MMLSAMLLSALLVPASPAQDPRRRPSNPRPWPATSGSADDHIQAGLPLFRRKRFAAARSHFEQAVAADPRTRPRTSTWPTRSTRSPSPSGRSIRTSRRRPSCSPRPTSWTRPSSRSGRRSSTARSLSAVLAAGLALAPADGATRPLELKDYYRLETASSPAISPDGRQVAFVRTYVVEGDNRRASEVWLAPADGGSPARRLTSPAFSSNAPRFSPDGKLLAFSSRRRVPGAENTDEPGVWFLRLDAPGGEAFQIEGVFGTPYFSPDNRWIAFTRKTPPAAPAKAPPADAFERRLAERFKGRIYEWMNYRSDGRGYLPDPADPAASPAEELYLVPREGGQPRQLTRLGVRVEGVAWRPDSQALVVTADAHQRDEWIYERADLWLVPLEGETRRLTDDGHHHEAPAFSPDGRTLVFRRQLGLSAVIESRQGHGAPVDLYAMPAGGGAMRSLTGAWDFIPGDPAFGADGRWVYFASGVGGDAHLFRAGLEGAAVEAVTRGARRLGGFSFSADMSRMAYTAGDPTHPAEVFAARSDGSDERALSALNAGLLREVELRPAEPLSFRSRDGTPVEGWVILPAAPRAGWPEAPSHPEHPRRAARRLPERLQLPVAALGGPRLRGALHQPARLDRLRREVPLGHLGRLGQPRLRGRAGRRGCRAGAVRPRRRAAGRVRLFLRRLPHQLADRPHAAFHRRHQRRGHLELGERLRHLRHPAHEGERVLRAALGAAQPGAADPPVARALRRRRAHTHALPPRRGGLPGADRAGRADVPGPAQAARARALRALSRGRARRLVTLGHRPPLPPGAALVGEAPRSPDARGPARPAWEPQRPRRVRRPPGVARAGAMAKAGRGGAGAGPAPGPDRLRHRLRARLLHAASGRGGGPRRPGVSR